MGESLSAVPAERLHRLCQITYRKLIQWVSPAVGLFLCPHSPQNREVFQTLQRKMQSTPQYHVVCFASENRNRYILWSAIVKLPQFVKRLKTIYIIVCETASHSESHYLLRVYDTILKKGAERINNDSRKGCDVVK